MIKFKGGKIDPDLRCLEGIVRSPTTLVFQPDASFDYIRYQTSFYLEQNNGDRKKRTIEHLTTVIKDGDRVRIYHPKCERWKRSNDICALELLDKNSKVLYVFINEDDYSYFEK